MSFFDDEVSHLISLHAQMQMSGFMPFAIGHVVNYDPKTNQVQCVIPAFPVVDPQTGAVTGDYATTPWMQLGSPWVGDGWGFQTAPDVGDAADPWSGAQCAICVVSQRTGASFVANLLYTDNATTPDSTLEAGESILKHKSGSYLRFNSDGSVSVNAAADLKITLGNGNVVSVNDVVDALALVSKVVSAFNDHYHTDSQGGNTSKPVAQWTAATIESDLVKVAS